MQTFLIRYVDDSDPGSPVFTSVYRAHSMEHALQRFYEGLDSDGWEVTAIALKRRGVPFHRLRWKYPVMR